MESGSEMAFLKPFVALVFTTGATPATYRNVKFIISFWCCRITVIIPCVCGIEQDKLETQGTVVWSFYYIIVIVIRYNLLSSLFKARSFW